MMDTLKIEDKGEAEATIAAEVAEAATASQDIECGVESAASEELA